MCIVLGIIFVIILIIGVWQNNSDGEEGLLFFGIFGTAAVIVLTIFMGVNLFESTSMIDDQIQLYSEENQKIESKIAVTVQNYMEFEKGIIESAAPDGDCMTLVTLYPDLTSDALVKSEIDTYISNNNKIKELKETKIKAKKYRFILYFGS